MGDASNACDVPEGLAAVTTIPVVDERTIEQRTGRSFIHQLCQDSNDETWRAFTRSGRSAWTARRQPERSGYRRTTASACAETGSRLRRRA